MLIFPLPTCHSEWRLKGPATTVDENRLLMEIANSLEQSPS
jgi:hypothetical protein